MNPEQLEALILNHKWIPLAAVVIGLIVRLGKYDTKIPINVPPQLRFWLALALGAVAGTLDKFVEGGNTTWTSALLHGGMASAIAILTHNGIIQSLNGGQELNIPGLIKPGVPPGPGKPTSLPPAPLDAKTILANAAEAEAALSNWETTNKLGPEDKTPTDRPARGPVDLSKE